MSVTIMSFINVIFITIVTTFFIGIKGMHIKRTVVDMPLTLFEEAIIPINEAEEISPHFDLNLVKQNVNNYLVTSLKDQCTKYLISFYPYKVVDENGVNKYYLETSEYIQNIQLHFSCNYFDNFDVDFYLRYALEEDGVIKNEY
jgi:hypothetical protein